MSSESYRFNRLSELTERIGRGTAKVVIFTVYNELERKGELNNRILSILDRVCRKHGFQLSELV